MTRVEIAWDRRTPANKIGLSKAIRKHTGTGLTQAKRSVDRCLQGETVIIAVGSKSEAEDFVTEIRSLGWTAWIVEGHDDACA
jgi:ribosomal protein L7/L12